MYPYYRGQHAGGAVGYDDVLAMYEVYSKCQIFTKLEILFVGKERLIKNHTLIPHPILNMSCKLGFLFSHNFHCGYILRHKNHAKVVWIWPTYEVDNSVFLVKGHSEFDDFDSNEEDKEEDESNQDEEENYTSDEDNIYDYAADEADDYYDFSKRGKGSSSTTKSPKTTTSTTTTTTLTPDYETSTHDETNEEDDIEFDICKGKIDSIAVIRNELFVFLGSKMWRYSHRGILRFQSDWDIEIFVPFLHTYSYMRSQIFLILSPKLLQKCWKIYCFGNIKGLKVI